MKLFARRRWPLVEGKVIDKRHIKKFLARFDSSQFTVSVDEYMVEFPLADGSGKLGRVVIKAQSVHIPPQGISVGQTVPLHVNPKGTKAVFGRFAPVVSRAERKRHEKNRPRQGRKTLQGKTRRTLRAHRTRSACRQVES